MEASAPLDERLQAEPPDWQPHALRFGGRLLCGSITFFFLAFLFAYFYLLALNTNGHFRIGSTQPPVGLGTPIAGLMLIGAIVYRLAARRRFADVLGAGIVALVCTLAAVALQFYEYTTLSFGAASGGYAAVFFGWTAWYAVLALVGACLDRDPGREPRAPASRWERATLAARGRALRRRRAAARGHRGVLLLLGLLRGDRRDRVHRPVPGMRR